MWHSNALLQCLSWWFQHPTIAMPIVKQCSNALLWCPLQLWHVIKTPNAKCNVMLAGNGNWTWWQHLATMTMFIMLVLALDNEEKRNQRGQKEKRRRRTEAIAMVAGARLKEKRRKKKIKQVKLGFSKWGAGQDREREFFKKQIISKLSEKTHQPSTIWCGCWVTAALFSRVR